MKIIHKIDDFLYTLFPEIIGGGISQIVNQLTERYTFNSIIPKVTIEDDYVIIEIDTAAIEQQDAEYNKALSFNDYPYLYLNSFSYDTTVINNLPNRASPKYLLLNL